VHGRARLAVASSLSSIAGVRTVLTGGTGVIRRAAVSSLLDAGHEVVVVTRTAPGSAEPFGAAYARGNVLDVESLAAAYAGADAVVNLATAVPVGQGARWPGAWRRHDRLRTSGVANVVEAARRAGVRRVVHESVSVLYADQGDDWITEESPLDITPVTEPAAVGESLVQTYACGSRIGVVLRFGTIVGDDDQTRYWLRSAANGRRVGIGHPADWAHVMHTDDLGGALLAALHAPSGLYNVGAEPVQRRDLVRGYADAAQVEAVEFMGAWGRWWVGRRLEPLSRSLRVSADHFAAQTGWLASRPKFDVGWLDAATHLHDLTR
jgi:nucleoside-diphosphate-sugar epimerase